MKGRSLAVWACVAAVALVLLPMAALGCSDASAALDRHNQYRARHGAGALGWDAGLASQAQGWANRLAANGCALQHSGTSGQGENLAMMGGSGIGSASCVKSTDMWYNEVSQYRFTNTPWTDNQANFHSIGHFTQLVWRESTRVGCAGASGNGCWVVVCRYTPAGNVVGDNNFLNNVKPASSSCTDLVSNCPTWAQQGYCDAKYVWQGQSVRNVQCRKSCGTCSDGSCTDLVSNCPTWAQQGYCDAKYVWQGQSVRNVQCRKSCGTCGSSGRRMMLSEPAGVNTTVAPTVTAPATDVPVAVPVPQLPSTVEVNATTLRFTKKFVDVN